MITRNQNLIACGLAASLSLAFVSAARSQQPAAPPAAAPEAGEPANKDDKATEPVQPVLEKNPAVRAALEMPRKKSRDYVQAILWLVDLGRPELAQPILAELAKLQLSDNDRVAIVSEFGSQGMLHLARAKELAPEGAAFADACLAAASAAANNPQRIAALVKQLTDKSAEVRTIARNDLSATGQVGVTAAIEALAHETDPRNRAALISAIELMHPLVDSPLLAMLTTNDANLRNDVATILQRLAVPQAVPFLPQTSVSPDKALTIAINNYKHGTPPFAVDESNQVEMWKWNDATKKFTSVRVPAAEAQIIWIARLADELARIRPGSTEDELEALVLRLESEGLTGSSAVANRINPALLAQADPGQLSAALASALKSNYSHAALALVEALAGRAELGVLYTPDGKPSPLADALISPSRRVRFAALKTIMALNPAAPYPGSSRVPEALAWFAGSGGDRTAVVAMPTIAAASKLAAQLSKHNIAAEPANRARPAVDIARAMPDLELVLVDMSIQFPDIRQAVYELRISPTTGDVPIAILAPDGRLDDAKRIASEHTRVIAVPRPHEGQTVANTVEMLAKLAPRDAVSTDERVVQAEQAKKWLAELSSGNRPFYVFRQPSLVSRVPAQQRTDMPAETPPPAAVPASEDLPTP